MAASKGKMSSEQIEQKLVLFNSSQESVQAMSLWIMHNKAHHAKIVDTWLKVLKKSDSKHKLTLFYLCNDVVQHAKKKKALYYLENFKDNLREAVTIVREFDSIKPNIERIFKIWDERRTYDAKFIKELRGIMDGGSSSKSSSASGTPAQASPIVYKPSSKVHRKDKSKKDKKDKKDKESEKHIKEIKKAEDTPDISGEFKPSTFIDQMTSLKKLEGDVNLKAKQLAALRIDATNIEAVKQLKDRSHGNEFCRQFEESCVKIEDYVAMLEKEISQRQLVLSMCENAEDFYCTLFDEAKVVANAYKNFGARVTNMKKRVDDMKKIIPSTPSPVPSPTADAPSPGNSPPLLDMDDNETIDMDLCIEDTEQSKQQDPVPIMPGRAYTAMVKSIGQPIASLTNIVMGQKDQIPKKESDLEDTDMRATGSFQGTNILESRIANMLPNLAKGASGIGKMGPPGIGGQATDMFMAEKAASQVPDVYTPPPRLDQSQPPQPVTPVEDAPSPEAEEVEDGGSSTPVQDEQEDKEETPPPKPVPAPKPVEAKTKTNPIDFLSQLLTKTSSSSSSSNFLQTLSLLTNTVKTQYQKKQEEEAEGPKQEEEPKPPSPTFTPGMNDSAKPAETEFTGVPPPVPISQASSWSGWKQLNTPQSDPSSPPLISQPKTPDMTHHPPPLLQHPPPPTESVQIRPFSIQPPSPQDFSLPPPSMRQNVSQSFINPPPPIPPPPSDSQQFNSQASSASFQQIINTQAGQPIVLTSSSSPTNLVNPQSGLGFTPNVPFGIAPPTSDSGLAQIPPGPPITPQPINPASGFPQVPSQQQVQAAGFPQPPRQPPPPPPISGFAPPPSQPLIRPPAPGPVFIQSRENIWESPRLVAPEPGQPNIQVPFIRGTFPHPPPPLNSAAPRPWQHEGVRAENPPTPTFTNQISSVPPQRPNWNNPGSNWERGLGDEESQSRGYAHPWDQPQNYDDEEEENDFVDEILETSLPPAPKKSILRNSRKSSLREVTLVEESSSTSPTEVLPPETSMSYTPVIPQVRDHKPVSILKRPSEVKHVTSHGDSAQSEFINILKQKSGPNSDLPDAPPSSRTLTTISTGEQMPPGQSSGNVSANHSHGEPISTIGVVGHSGRPSSVQSDDMDLDTDERDFTNRDNDGQWHHEAWRESTNADNPEVNRQDFSQPEGSDMHSDFDNHKGFDGQREFDRHNFERHPDFERQREFDRPDFNGPSPRQGWSDQRSWQHRPQGPPDQGGFRPRDGYQPRPRFQDNFRGPSPAKRPYFPPRQRMPFNRY